MIKEEFINKVWNYYIILEDDFIATFKYVEPCDENSECYSKEYGKLLLSICSEIDNVCRELCKKIEGKTDKDVNKYNINNYKNIIYNYNGFNSADCSFIVNKEVINPWLQWNTNDSPDWWKDYNHLKHNRLIASNYKLGNYKNVKMALSALYILCRFYYKNNYDLEPFPKSNIFSMNNWNVYTLDGKNMIKVDDGKCVKHCYNE